MWITGIQIDGVPIALDETLAQVVIRHGRADAWDSPNSSTIQLTMIDVTHGDTAPFRVGVPINVSADGAPRFTGTITDAALDDDVLTVIGVGPLSTLSRLRIGADPWPGERWSERVRRAFTEAGVPDLLLLMPDIAFDPLLVAREPGEVELLSYLGQLADDVGAAIADTPDGFVLVQQLTARQMLAGVAWETLPDSFAWADVDPSCSWEEATNPDALGLPALLPELIVDPDDVSYVPAWLQMLELENETSIGYGDNETVTVSESTSVSRYGSYPGGVSTQIASLEEATIRASQRVDRRAYPRWNTPAAPLLDGFPLQIGQVVQISGFPDASPHATWKAVLEGWSDTIEGPNWTCELALSDPIYSGVSLNWEDVPEALAWNECDAACSWIDASSLDALAPDFPGLVLVNGGVNA